jgi:hypothetical protein
MRSAGEPDDAFWRRPAGSPADGESLGRPPADRGPAGEAPRYAGPPPSQPPPPGFRTPHVVRPAPPRELPEQDLPALEQEERDARTLTLGIGMIAGAVVLILVCLLCSRALF